MARTHHSPRRDPYEIEAVLEMQEFLLLKLARQDNGANGLSQDSSTSLEDLERLKIDTAQAVQATWIKAGKKKGIVCEACMQVWLLLTTEGSRLHGCALPRSGRNSHARSCRWNIIS